MAKSYHGIFLEPMNSAIQNELKRRQAVEENRGITGLNKGASSWGESIEKNFNANKQKLAWCKLLSNAEGGGITKDIRYQNQLVMGHMPLNPNPEANYATMGPPAETITRNFSSAVINPAQFTSGFKKDDDKGKNFGDYNLDDRNRPRTGIDKISILNKGALGSIRQATIDFFVYTEEDLEMAEKLYMIPGITCVLEWGWNTYEGNTIDDRDYTTMDAVQKGIISKTFDQVKVTDSAGTASWTSDYNKQAGNYDGMLGVITKFSWDIMADGGYSCQTTMISPNGLAGEIPTKSSNFNMQKIEIPWNLYVKLRGSGPIGNNRFETMKVNITNDPPTA